MDDDEVDLEDLETRLYCEVYHSKPEDEEMAPNVNIAIQQADPPSRSRLGYVMPRYFKEPPRIQFTSNLNEQFVIDSIGNNSIHQSDLALPPVVQNVIFLNTPDARKQAADKRKARRKKTKELRRIEREMRRMENQEKEANKLNLTTSHIRFPKNKEEDNEVICLSDGEDCVVVETPDNKQDVLKVEEICSSDGDIEEDDSVIFVEPEPVPLIDLEEIFEPFSTPTKTSVATIANERRELLQTPESTASNDFLDNSNVDVSRTSFNFSLHGSDFNTATEFVRPQVPQTDNETESSCSTTDLNKDFNTSLRSAVFNEVEFPREDIFSGNNLEAFGNYITPKRGNVTQQPSRTVEIASTSTPNVYTSGSSSEESDVEVASKKKATFDKNLPELSPMPNSIVKKHNAKRKSDAAEGEGKKVKRKKNKSKSEDVENVPTSESSGKIRAKRHSSAAESEGDNQCGDTNKKKKKKNEEQENNEVLEEAVDNPDNNKTKKKKKRLSEAGDDNVQVEDDIVDTPAKSKKKKKRLLTDTKEADDAVVDNNVEETPTEIKIEKTPDQEVIDQPEADSDVELIDNTELIILDEVNCSSSDSSLVPIEEHISVVDISDSEDDYIDPNIGKDLELANCSSNSLDKTQNSCNSDLPVNRTRFSERWNPNQEVFYGTIYNNNFDVDAIQRTMKDDPECWKIDMDDRFPRTTQFRTGPRCRSCREFGHLAAHCPTKRNIQCSLCGLSGHYEPRCPNRMCTQCGNPGNYSTTYCWKCVHYATIQCNICEMFGHISEKCPDLWRRYHLTTEEGPLVTLPYPQLKAKHLLWCSGCAQNGHLEQSCGYLNRCYPPADIKIHKYKDVYLQAEARNISFGAPIRGGATNIIIQLPQQPATSVQNFTITPEYNNSSNQSIASNKEPPYSKFFKIKTIRQIQTLIKENLDQLNSVNDTAKSLLSKLYQAEALNKKTNNWERGDYKNLMKNLNMFLFGIHKLCEGRQNLDHLISALNFNSFSKFNPRERKHLFHSFNYIFSTQPHNFVNYKRLLSRLIVRNNQKR